MTFENNRDLQTMETQKRECKYIAGRYKDTIECANCMYNRIVDAVKFECGQRRGNYTAGTECLKEKEADNGKR
jgi:hypothetical protein